MHLRASPLPNNLFRRAEDAPSVAEVSAAVTQYHSLIDSVLVNTGSSLTPEIIDPLWDPVWAIVQGNVSTSTTSIDRRQDVGDLVDGLIDTVKNFLEHIFSLDDQVVLYKRSVDNLTEPSDTITTPLDTLQGWADGTLPIPRPSDGGPLTQQPLTIEEIDGFTNALAELIRIWRSDSPSVDTSLRKRMDPFTVLAVIAICRLIEEML